MPPFVLKKKPPSKTISNTDLFKVNVDFTSRLYRVKINQIQAKETEEEQKATTAKVFGDRQYAIDACLVRIMKSRKQLSHSLLISEAITQLKFPVEVSDIKQRISSLLEREYIERDKDNSSTYNYLA